MDVAKSTRVYQIGIDTFATNAHAKLNITLDILRKERNGMHLINSVMQTISMADMVTLERLPKGRADAGKIEISGPVIGGNLAERAINEVMLRCGSLSCSIHLDKSIPSFAGLGGGSSDAAAVIRLANAAFGLGMNASQMCGIAQKVGSDVPFFIYGGRATVGGENQGSVRQMPMPVQQHYLIARPNMRLGTEEMYKLHDKTGRNFTELASDLCPETKRLLECLRKGALECGVTGKGPTVFAGFRTYGECKAACSTISWFEGDVFLERAVG